MLTKTDVKFLDDRLDLKLDRIFDKKLKPIHDDIKIIKKDVKKLKKDVDGVIFMADKGLLSVQSRVRTIEKTLKIPTPDFV